LGRSGLRAAVADSGVGVETGGNVEVGVVRGRGESEGIGVAVAVAVAAGEIRRCAVKKDRS
jgi:hypothetical protein